MEHIFQLALRFEALSSATVITSGGAERRTPKALDNKHNYRPISDSNADFQITEIVHVTPAISSK